MQLASEIAQILKTALIFGGLCGLSAIIYRFLTLQKTRVLHHRWMRIIFYRLYRTSWFDQSKKASLYVLRLLNYIYHPPAPGSRLFSVQYFNNRSWKASFSIAIFYLIGFGVAISIIGTHYEDKSEQLFDLVSNMFIFVFTFILTGLMYFIIRRMPFFLKKDNASKFGKEKTFKASTLLVLLYIVASFILRLDFIWEWAEEMFFLAVAPLWLVWHYGIRGLYIYVLSGILYLVLDLPLSTIDAKYNLFSGFADQFFRTIYQLLILYLIYILNKAKHISYTKSYLVVLMGSLFALLMFIITTPASDIPGGHGTLIMILWIIAFFFFLLWSIVAANSISDLVSSNVSRWLFEKIQHVQRWRDIVYALLIDLVIGVSLIFFTAIIIGVLIAIAFPVIEMEWEYGLNSMISILEGNKDAGSYKSNVTMMPVINAWLLSYLLIPSIVFDINIEEYLINETLTKLTIVFWFFYISVLIPSLLHALSLFIVMASKLLSQLIQSPSMYIHRLLLEKNTFDDYFGKSFTGTARATALIGIMVSSFVVFILFVIKLI